MHVWAVSVAARQSFLKLRQGLAQHRFKALSLMLMGFKACPENPGT
jgi:hypothetical protein